VSIFAATFALLWSPGPVEFTDYATFSSYPETTITKVTYKRIPHHKIRKRVQHADPPPSSPMNTALASYYDLSGTGACGVPAQDGYAFANLSLPCGTRVTFCYTSCVTATMDDRGPYVSGRLFDLNVNLKDALGCPDLCEVRWKVT
jgi:rare lipoprotein A (peptidoglycan hydrolase)